MLRTLYIVTLEMTVGGGVRKIDVDCVTTTFGSLAVMVSGTTARH